MVDRHDRYRIGDRPCLIGIGIGSADQEKSLIGRSLEIALLFKVYWKIDTVFTPSAYEKYLKVFHV